VRGSDGLFVRPGGSDLVFRKEAKKREGAANRAEFAYGTSTRRFERRSYVAAREAARCEATDDASNDPMQ
jgi:hypothetical protein